MANGQTQTQAPQTPQTQQPPPSGQTVPAFSPDGTLGDIPVERVHDAVKSGFKLGVDLVSPDGQPGAIPVERVHDALQKGFKLPTTMPENYGFTAGNMAGQAWQGTKELVGGLYTMGKDVLFPDGATEGEKLRWLANKYIFDPADEQERKAQKSTSTLEPIKDPESMADAAHSAANKLWENEAQPQVDRHGTELMTGKDAADAIRNGVDEGTRDLFPDQAKEADALADKLDGLMSLRKPAAYLKTLNAQ